MSDVASPTAEVILRLCAETAPEPWYPSLYAHSSGVTRDSLDPVLDELRMGGLIRLTDWVQGSGQGYAMTPEGARVLDSPRELTRLREGKFVPRAEPAATMTPARRGRVTVFERGEATRAALLYHVVPVVTRILIVLNCLVFLAGATVAYKDHVSLSAYLYGGGDARLPALMHKIGALYPADIFADDSSWGWLRLLTCCFAHFGLLHLGINMYTLYVIGPDLERLWGHGRFLALYLIAGLAGSATAMISGSPRILLAGASGALWGAMASEVAWIVLNRRYLPTPAVRARLRMLGSVFLLNAFISFLPQISAAAHFGGGAAGLVTGLLLNCHRFEVGWIKTLGLLGVLAIPLGFLGLLGWTKAQQEAWFLQEHVVRESSFPDLQLKQQEIQRLYKEIVTPLLRQDAKGRDRAEILQSLGRIDDISADLRQEVRALQGKQLGADGRLEKARAAWVQLLEADTRLFRLSARCLRSGEQWTNEEEDELDQQWHRVEELRRQAHRLSYR